MRSVECKVQLKVVALVCENTFFSNDISMNTF